MNIKFQKVKECDIDLLFKWSNDIDVRNNSFNKDYIQYGDHLSWFENKINSKDTYIFICYFNGNAIGQIRIDLEDNTGLIDYSIETTYRGKGLGTLILEGIEDVIRENDIKINKLVGKVKYKNIPSQKAFKRTRFNEKKKEDYIKYVKEI